MSAGALARGAGPERSSRVAPQRAPRDDASLTPVPRAPAQPFPARALRAGYSSSLPGSVSAAGGGWASDPASGGGSSVGDGASVPGGGYLSAGGASAEEGEEDGLVVSDGEVDSRRSQMPRIRGSGAGGGGGGGGRRDSDRGGGVAAAPADSSLPQVAGRERERRPQHPGLPASGATSDSEGGERPCASARGRAEPPTR